MFDKNCAISARCPSYGSRRDTRSFQKRVLFLSARISRIFPSSHFPRRYISNQQGHGRMRVLRCACTWCLKMRPPREPRFRRRPDRENVKAKTLASPSPPPHGFLLVASGDVTRASTSLVIVTFGFLEVIRAEESW